MTVVFVSYRIALITFRIRIGMTVVLVSHRIALNTVRIRIGMTVVLVSHRIHWIQWELESVWEWSLFPRYTEYNENKNRYNCDPRFPSDSLNTVRIKISMTVVFVSYRIHWMQIELESMWELSSFPIGYTVYSDIRIGMTFIWYLFPIAYTEYN